MRIPLRLHAALNVLLGRPTIYRAHFDKTLELAPEQPHNTLVAECVFYGRAPRG